MILAVDADYRTDCTIVAGITFSNWEDEFSIKVVHSAVGITYKAAKEHKNSMYGKYRMPTLLKLLDRACRKS